MGKATIVSGGPDGSYQVRLDYGKATQTARLEAIAARLVVVAEKLVTALEDLNLQEYTEAESLAAVEAATNAYVDAARAEPAQESALKKALSDYTAAMAKLATAKRKTAPLKLAWQLLKDEKAQLQKDQDKWGAMVLEETVQAWCLDLTEDAAGEVATVEVPGENKRVLVAPAGPAPGPYDGVLTAREVQTPEQLFWNAAVLPGWQKFKPTFRTGVVTGKSGGKLDVTLDAATSSAQDLPINQSNTLEAVPVVYMTCNDDAFDVNDKCVVRFGMDWSTPEVVGFVDNPKPCFPFEFFAASVSEPPTDANYFARCTDSALLDDIVDNPHNYVCQFAVEGGGWTDMTYLGGSGMDVFAAGGSISARPHLAFTKSFAMAQIRGVTVDLFASQYFGLTLAFRARKGDKTVMRLAIKNDAALYAGSYGSVVGAKIANPIYQFSGMPLQKFEFVFPQ